MIGHLQILQARKRLLKPMAIFFDFGVEPIPARYRFEDQESAIVGGAFPTVTVPPDEMLVRHDLRFVVGCRVHVHGQKWTDEILAFADQIVRSGAVSVVVICTPENGDLMEWANGEWRAYAG